MSADYIGLELSSPTVAETPPSHANRLGWMILETCGKAGRYVLNAIALSAGEVVGAYCSFYTLSQIAPLNIHVTVTASLPGPV